MVLDGVSLRYQSRSSTSAARGLLDVIRRASQVRPKLLPSGHAQSALTNVNLEIVAGERVALLGGNGAGKTSLIKVISGIYPISDGVMEIEGKVDSLLELSLGFEPAATGWENIMFRGLLAGMTPTQINQLRPSIVEFSGLGEKIYFPLNTYSAGMQVRLAFSISTALEPEILILDEVFGAGDAEFMARAQRRVLDLAEKADIVIMASHDLTALQQICQRGVVMMCGEIAYDGSLDSAARFYLSQFAS